MSEIVTSTFKVGTACCGGCGVWVPSAFCGDQEGRGGLSGVFPTIFVLYLNDLLSEALSSASSISPLYNFLMSWNNSDYILTDYTLAWLYQDLLHCLLMYC